MIASVEPLKSGFALDDPTDPRHIYITNLKRKFGAFLHDASVSLLQQGEENTVDAVHMLVRDVEIRLSDVVRSSCHRFAP